MARDPSNYKTMTIFFLKKCVCLVRRYRRCTTGLNCPTVTCSSTIFSQFVFFVFPPTWPEFTNGEALRNTIRVASMFSGQNVLAQCSLACSFAVLTIYIGPQWHNTFTTQILPCTLVTRKHLQFIMFTVRIPLLHLSLYSMLMRQTQ